MPIPLRRPSYSVALLSLIRSNKTVKEEIERLSVGGPAPCLAAVRVGDDPASAVYVRNKIQACAEVGIKSEHHALPETTTTTEVA